MRSKNRSADWSSNRKKKASIIEQEGQSLSFRRFSRLSIITKAPLLDTQKVEPGL